MDFFTLWDQVLDYIDQYDPPYSSMFSTEVFPLSMTGGTLTISVKNKRRQAWIENVYKAKLEKIMYQITGERITIAIHVDGQEAPKAPPPKVPAPEPSVAEEAAPFPSGVKETPLPYDVPSPFENTPAAAPTQEDAPFPEEAAPPDFSQLKPMSADQASLPDIHSLEEISLFESTPKAEPKKKNDSFLPNPVNEDYTFDTFVHGNCNEMAFQAACAVASSAVQPDQPDQKMNPLFIYGPSGLGKTHLLHAICNFVRAHKPEMSVLFVSSETFTNELIDAIQNRTMPKFRSKYRNLDFLLIDDVQFFGSKDATKMEIFNTFNDLFDKKKHIIMTSDRTPADIDKLEDRLQTRFSSGLVVPISPPDYEICCIILQKRAEKLGLTLDKDVVDYIASHINTNVRELEGAFNKLVTFAKIKKQPITLAFTKDALKDQIPLDGNHELTVDFIIDTVCQYYGVKKDKLLGKGRPQKIVIPRQMAMYLCRKELNESYPSLRDYFHRKDHSTVLYACERVEKEIEKSAETRAALEAIRKLLKQRA